MRKNTGKPSTLKNVLKAFLVLGLAVNWLYVAFAMVEMAFEESTDYYNSDAFLVNQCDKYYYERKYDELFEHMHLYDTYDEMYDVYWEVMDAYVDLQEYLKWKKVSADDITDARKMEKLYYDKVTEAAHNCRFPQNQKYLDDFVEMLE